MRNVRLRHRLRAVATIVAVTLGTLSWVAVASPPAAHADAPYSASAGFSSTQGANQWRYQTRPSGGGSYTDMASFSAGAWRTTGDAPWISAGGLHPGPTTDAVRTWVAPTTGTVAIIGQVAKADTSGGNGVVVSVAKNGTNLWSRTIAYNDSTGYSTDAYLTAVSVVAGDLIYFIVNNNGDYGADATNWSPTVTYTYYGAYSSSAGFSSTQGGDHWYYAERAIGSGAYTDLTFSSGAWRGAGGAWINGTGTHPDNSADAARKWIAPSTGTISITGQVAKSDTSCGNGVVASVLRNTSALWSQTIAYNDGTGYVTDGALGDVYVNAGDAIYFIVGNNGDYSCDATSWNPTISYSTAPLSWNASSGFTSTQGANNWRYQQRPIGTHTFTDMAFSSGAWRGGNGNWIGINNTHPDNSDDSVRTWVAPSAGTVNITGQVYKINYLGGSNGVVATVQKNNTMLWSTTVAGDDWKGYFLDGHLGGIPVLPGDQIHFIINNNGDWGADETGFDPTVTYTGTAPSNTSYYISAVGNDQNSGTDATHPWQTVAPVNRIHYFGSGVQILFRGGDTFTGGLTLSLVGSSGSRDVLGSYGAGNATLTDRPQPTTDIVDLGNSEYLTTQHLNLVATPGTNYGTNSFVSVNHSTGLKIYSTRSSGTKWRSDYIDNVYFDNSRLGAWYDSHADPFIDGFDDVRITNSTFDSTPLIGALVYSNGAFAGGPVNQNSNVYIGHDTFIHNYGDPQHPSEAQPIEVTGTTGTTIEQNKVADNCGYGGYSPVGGSTAIGISNSRNFKIQYNEIYGTKSSTRYDGSAIDADQDALNGEIAYNLTYNNGGPAIQLGSFGGKTTSNIAIHHNMSYDDVRGNTGASVQGAIRVWGHTDAIQIFNNTVYVDKTGTTSGSIPSALSFESVDSGANTNTKVWNNIFKTTGGIPIIRPNGTGPGEDNPTHISSNDQFIANLYDSSGSALTISTDNTVGAYTAVTSLPAWQTNGQEKIGSTNYGIAADAGLTSLAAPTGYLPGSPVGTFSFFNLTSTSPARGQALSPWSIITESPPVSIQTTDYHGNTAAIKDIGGDTY